MLEDLTHVPVHICSCHYNAYRNILAEKEIFYKHESRKKPNALHTTILFILSICTVTDAVTQPTPWDTSAIDSTLMFSDITHTDVIGAHKLTVSAGAVNAKRGNKMSKLAFIKCHQLLGCC